MSPAEIAQKTRQHLGRAKASALMMANAQSSLNRERYLQTLSKELKAAVALLEKLEKEKFEKG
jgi:hypothetical protein